MEMVYGKVTLKKVDLFGPFAVAFGSLANNKDIPPQVKIKLLKLKSLLKDEGIKFDEVKKMYQEKGDKITAEERETFNTLCEETFTVDFEQIDTMLVISHLTMNELEALRPILKGLK